MNIVEQLMDFYYNCEDWYRKEKMPHEESQKYFTRLLENGAIITVTDGNILCGYVEFWRVGYEQFGRIICGESFSAYHEDIYSGNIAYVANTYIRPEYRRGSTYRQLRDRFFEVNQSATHFCGEARRKKSAPLKVFKRSEILARV